MISNSPEVSNSNCLFLKLNRTELGEVGKPEKSSKLTNY